MLKRYPQVVECGQEQPLQQRLDRMMLELEPERERILQEMVAEASTELFLKSYLAEVKSRQNLGGMK